MCIKEVQSSETSVQFKFTGNWPVGVCDSRLTLRLKGLKSKKRIKVDILQDNFIRANLRKTIDTPIHDGDDWLVTIDAVPERTVGVYGD